MVSKSSSNVSTSPCLDESCEANQVSIPSFWEIDQYGYTVARASNGYKKCNDMVSFLNERAECERVFAKQLRNWSKRWREHFDGAKRTDRLEYGTTAKAWKAFLDEANRKADIHFEIGEEVKSVINRVKNWQKENYVRTMLTNKTVKEYEEEFHKAQKPWAKAYLRMQRAKKDYQMACRLRNSVDAQKMSADLDETMPAENRRKIAEKLDRLTRDADVTEQKYRDVLAELDHISLQYKEDMCMVFNRTQEFERDRMMFFKDIFRSAHGCLDTSNKQNLKQHYADLICRIEDVDPDLDVSWWSSIYGPDATLIVPGFEEYGTSDITSLSETTLVGPLISSSNPTNSSESVKLNTNQPQPVDRDNVTVNPDNPQCSMPISETDSADANDASNSGIQSVNTNGIDMENLRSPNEGKKAHPTGSRAIGFLPQYTNPDSAHVCGSVRSAMAISVDDDLAKTVSDDLATTMNGKQGVGVQPNGAKEIRHIGNIPIMIPARIKNTDVVEYPEICNPFHAPIPSVLPNTSARIELTKNVELRKTGKDIQVKALYSYAAQEDDELSLFQGMVFTMIEDEDEQGWSKGRYKDKEGLYPAAYAKPI